MKAARWRKVLSDEFLPRGRQQIVTCRDAIRGVFANTGETACSSVRLRKLSDAQYTNYERFPKLDVAGSNPISRPIFNTLRTMP
jgi:hypothetical protein